MRVYAKFLKKLICLGIVKMKNKDFSLPLHVNFFTCKGKFYDIKEAILAIFSKSFSRLMGLTKKS